MRSWLGHKFALLVLAYGIVAGGWVYLAVRITHGPVAGWIAFVAITTLLGGIVRRWWVLLGVAGPMAAFVALELTGDFGRGDWPDFAIFSLPTLFYASLIVTALLFGWALAEGVAWVAAERRSRLGP